MDGSGKTLQESVQTVKNSRKLCEITQKQMAGIEERAENYRDRQQKVDFSACIVDYVGTSEKLCKLLRDIGEIEEIYMENGKLQTAQGG